MTDAAAPVSRRKALGADLTLLLVTFFWGATFVVVQNAIRDIHTLSFLAIRFTLASMVLSLLLALRRERIPRRTVAVGAAMGSVLFLAYLTQTLGLVTTTPSRAGFLTGLSVAIVPILSALVLRRPPSRGAVAGVVLALAGLFLMMGPGDDPLVIGDVLVMGCAFLTTGHIILTGRYTGEHSPLALTTVQIGTVALWSWVGAFLFAPRGQVVTDQAWFGIVVTALTATVFAFWAQTAMQRITPPTRAALIFAGEPVFAALFDWWCNGRLLPAAGYLGGALILAGMVAAEFSPANGDR